MKTIGTTILTTLSLCIAPAWAHAQSPAAFVAAQAPAVQLGQCMKMPMGSPQQKGCISAVQLALVAMRAPPAPPPAPIPAKAATIPDAPPEVKSAAQQLRLAGASPPGAPAAPGAAALPIANISGMDPQSALLALQRQQATLMKTQTGAQLSDMQARSAQMQQAEETMARLQAAAAMSTAAASVASGAMAMTTIASGVAGAHVIASMKNAGLDTSKIVMKTVNGQQQYQASAAQMTAYKEQLAAKVSALNTDQKKQADVMQAMMANNKQLVDTLANYINAMAAQNAAIIGKMNTH